MLANISKRILSAVLVIGVLSGLFVSAQLAMVQALTPAEEACMAVEALGGAKCDATAQTGISNTVKTVVNVMSFIVGIISVIMIIIAGIRFTTSGGDPQAASGARQTIIYAVIGIVIVIMAQVIVAFVLDRVDTTPA
jgi:hypothetical protein